MMKASIEEFSKDGYIAIPELYDQEKIAEINENVDRFIADVLPTMPATRIYYENKADKTTLKQIQKMFEYDDYFFELMNQGVIRRIAESLLQESVVPINMQFFNKPPASGGPTPPHQDGYYFHLKPCRAVTGWLALEPVDEWNGCIHYVRGSHKTTRFRPHGKSNILGFSQGITDFGSDSDIKNSVGFPGPAGTFLMHDARTIHYADANQSTDRSRRALGFIYYAESAQEDIEAKYAYQKKLDKQLANEQKI